MHPRVEQEVTDGQVGRNVSGRSFCHGQQSVRSECIHLGVYRSIHVRQERPQLGGREIAEHGPSSLDRASGVHPFEERGRFALVRLVEGVAEELAGRCQVADQVVRIPGLAPGRPTPLIVGQSAEPSAHPSTLRAPTEYGFPRVEINR